MSWIASLRTMLGVGASSRELRHQEDLLTSLLVMAWMVEARDPYTGGHLWRVSQFSHRLASAAGLQGADLARVTVGAFLHDLGKVSVPDHILGKKDRLSEEEYAVIKTHPEQGWRLLAGHPLAHLVEAAVRAHHETPDGKGYPLGLVAAAIALDARIVGICDAFDAMTSTRPYRKGMPQAQALDIIEQNLGSQFDPDMGARFVALGRSGAFDHIVAHSDAGIPLQECLMCGPTIVLARGHVAGSHVYCPACAGEYASQRANGSWRLVPTGNKGAPGQLEPQVDSALIRDVVRASARSLLE